MTDQEPPYLYFSSEYFYIYHLCEKYSYMNAINKTTVNKLWLSEYSFSVYINDKKYYLSYHKEYFYIRELKFQDLNEISGYKIYKHDKMIINKFKLHRDTNEFSELYQSFLKPLSKEEFNHMLETSINLHMMKILL